MIGYLKGNVLFSDGFETILLTTNGVGHQIYFNKVLAEGIEGELYVSHIVKEASEDLYGFTTLRSKKLFELLLKVKNVGPKSAYSLISALGPEQIINAILLENKAALKKAPGVGERAAAQMILDLSGKISKVKMYSDNTKNNQMGNGSIHSDKIVEEIVAPESIILNDAIMACKELGFVEEKILPLANKLILENKIMKAEQLVHLVLREL
jgi:holliday junction DNA helicase RuvA